MDLDSLMTGGMPLQEVGSTPNSDLQFAMFSLKPVFASKQEGIKPKPQSPCQYYEWGSCDGNMFSYVFSVFVRPILYLPTRHPQDSHFPIIRTLITPTRLIHLPFPIPSNHRSRQGKFVASRFWQINPSSSNTLHFHRTVLD